MNRLAFFLGAAFGLAVMAGGLAWLVSAVGLVPVVLAVVIVGLVRARRSAPPPAPPPPWTPPVADGWASMAELFPQGVSTFHVADRIEDVSRDLRAALDAGDIAEARTVLVRLNRVGAAIDTFNGSKWEFAKIVENATGGQA
jgi:hypothetical protein